MKNTILFMAVLLAIVAPAVAQKPTTVAKTNAVSAPQQAAKAWLSLVDKKDYVGSYKATAKTFQKAVNATQWNSSVENARKPFGALKSRALLKGQRLTSIPNMPTGEYAILQYQANFESATHAIETVSLEREGDKQWRVNGYFIKAVP